MRHIFAYMRRNAPKMQILIVGILPRGAWSLPDPFAWPNRLTEGINTVNNASQVLNPLCLQDVCSPKSQTGLSSFSILIMGRRESPRLSQ